MSVTVELVCSEHPKYTAKKKPVGQCEACWTIWAIIDDINEGNFVYEPAKATVKHA